MINMNLQSPLFHVRRHATRDSGNKPILSVIADGLIQSFEALYLNAIWLELDSGSLCGAANCPLILSDMISA